MERAANNNWSKGQLPPVPHAWWDDSLWSYYQTRVHDRLGAALRAMYSNLLQQPLSPRLVKLIRQIDTRLETSRYAG